MYANRRNMILLLSRVGRQIEQGTLIANKQGGASGWLGALLGVEQQVAYLDHARGWGGGYTFNVLLVGFIRRSSQKQHHGGYLVPELLTDFQGACFVILHDIMQGGFHLYRLIQAERTGDSYHTVDVVQVGLVAVKLSGMPSFCELQCFFNRSHDRFYLSCQRYIGMALLNTLFRDHTSVWLTVKKEAFGQRQK